MPEGLVQTAVGELDFPKLAQYDRWAIDIEATGLDWKREKMFAISLTAPNLDSWYIDTRHGNNLEWAKDMLPRHTGAFIGHNLKFDLHFFWNEGIKLFNHKIHDTMVGAALLNEHEEEFTLEWLAHKYTDLEKYTGLYEVLAEMFGGKPTKNAQMPNLHKAPLELAAKYGMDDTRSTMALFEYEQFQLERQKLLLVDDVEMRLLPVLLKMERRGVRVDVNAAEEALVRMDEVIGRRQEKLNFMAGFNINVNSSKQVRELLKPIKTGPWRWELPDGTFIPTTDKGAPSFKKDFLKKSRMPEVQLLLGLRGAKKIKGTFLEGHILGNHFNGRLHTNFNQTKAASEDDDEYGTTSGRLSSNNPNIQQISKRDPEAAAIVRSLFLPEEGQLWNCRDWNQMDFRIFAHYAQSPPVMQAYRDDPQTDFHGMVAKMMGIPRKPTPGVKGDAKSINLGLCFGMGKGKMAEQMGLPYTEEERPDGSKWKKAGEEAEELFLRYHAAVPGVKTTLDAMTTVAKRRGYVRTILGRHIRFPRGEKTYKAGAMIFQGSAADALKVKMIEVDAILDGSAGSFLLNVHDEFDSSLPPGSEGQRLSMAIGEAVENFDGESCPIKFDVPIRSSVKFAEDWWEASRDD